MRLGMPERATWLEAGLVLTAVGLIGGLAVLVFGRAAGGVRRGRRRDEDPPAPGSVSPNRHQNIAAASPR